MTTSDDVMRILVGRRQRTGRVATAASALAADIGLVAYAGALVVAAYVLGHPLPSSQIALALLVCALGIGAVGSVWLCSQFRGFRVVMAVTLAWVVFWVAALWQTILPELPVAYTALVLLWHVGAAWLLWSGRRAFAPIPG